MSKDKQKLFENREIYEQNSDLQTKKILMSL